MLDPPARIRSRPDLIVGALVGTALVATLLVPAARHRLATECTGTLPLVASVSTEKAILLDELAREYNKGKHTAGGACVEVTVYSKTSGATTQALVTGWDQQRDGGPAPHIWLPTSSLWLRLLDHQKRGDLVVDGPQPSIASSALVIAMPAAVVDALGTAGRPRRWADILTLAQSGWDGRGRPAWGRFTLGRDNPHISTSGLAATVAVYHAAGVRTVEQLDDLEVLHFVRGIESSVTRYGGDATAFMVEIYSNESKRSGDAGYRPYIDAMVVQEQLAFLYNCGAPGGDPGQVCTGNQLPPERRMVAIHPEDGTVKLDHPFVVLSSASPQQRAAAEGFRAFLQEPMRQRQFTEHGFREPDNGERPTEALANVLGIDRNQNLRFVDPPPGALIAGMLDRWDDASRKARVLLVLDVSGSMNDDVDEQTPGNQSKLDRLKVAAARAIDLLHDDDQIGLWTFSSPSHAEVLPISRVKDVRQLFKDRINGLAAAGQTELYGTTAAAHRMMLDNFDPNRINAIVLLSDGQQTPERPQAERDHLIAQVDAANWDNTVRIFTIPYGSAPNDFELLKEIAARSRAANIDASNPVDIDKVFAAVFGTF